MTQFTASEVRKWADALMVRAAPTLSGILHAYADRLEADEKADEKAVPVRQFRVVPKGSVWTDVKDDELWGTVMLHPESYEPRTLYTHPAPADAERLAEALREIADFDCGCMPCTGECRKGRAAEIELQARMEIAQKALAAHSAQAQPPAASVPDIETMVNRFLAWRLPKPWHPDNGISYTRPNYAHEPAEHDWPTGTNLFDAHQAREMVEYMLAAQENPNG